MSMTGTYGRQVLATTGAPIQLAAASLASMSWKTGGITLDWATIPPNLSATPITLGDQTQVNQGNSALEYGVVLTKITATGLYGPWTGAPPAATTLNGATGIGATTLTLASAASIFPGDPIDVDTAGNIEHLRVAAVAGNVVTLATPAALAHANGVAVVKTADGRNAMVNGECFVLNQTVLRNPVGGMLAAAVNHPAVLYGGPVWLARLKVGGTNQPTLAQLLAACPTLHPVEMS